MTSPEPLIPVDAARVRDVLARHDQRKRARWRSAGAFIFAAGYVVAFASAACWQGFPP